MQDVLISLINKRLTQDQIADELEISPTTLRRRLKQFNLQTNPIQNFQGNGRCFCIHCGCDDSNQFYYRNKQHTIKRIDVCKSCISIRKRIIAWNHKCRAVQLLGSKCLHCNLQSLYPVIFDFHHINQSSKHKGGRNHAFDPNWNWNRIEKELQNCILLCANCHRIEHAGVSNRGQIASVKSQYTINAYNKTKSRILEYYNNQCHDCNLVSQFHQIYDLHHLNPSAKEFILKDLVKRSWSNVLPELEKCILLCANCHRIKHAVSPPVIGNIWDELMTPLPTIKLVA